VRMLSMASASWSMLELTPKNLIFLSKQQADTESIYFLVGTPNYCVQHNWGTPTFLFSAVFEVRFAEGRPLPSQFRDFLELFFHITKRRQTAMLYSQGLGFSIQRCGGFPKHSPFSFLRSLVSRRN